MKKEELEKSTRKIFHKLHTLQGEDNYIFGRLATLLSESYLKLEKGWFQGKICLDAGCGSNANGTYTMLQLGAGKVYAFDLDETIFETVPNRLKNYEGKYILSTGNVLNISREDNFFDFTHCSGVLHHTHDVFKGLKELARVTKKGGVLYILTYGRGGVIRDITSLLREKYINDAGFSEFIDNLDETYFMELCQWVIALMSSHGDDLGEKIPLSLLKTLFDKDLVLTIKDRITAPVYHENSEEEIVNWLKENGFSKIERLKRYPPIKNIRRFLCPLYYEYDSKYAKMLYGDGCIQLKAIKRA